MNKFVKKYGRILIPLITPFDDKQDVDYMSFFEVGKYVLDMAHQYEASIIIINEEFWNSLSAEDQAILQSAMDDGAAFPQIRLRPKR